MDLSPMSSPRDLPQRRRHRLAAPLYAATEYAYYFTVCARHHGVPFGNRQLADMVINSLLWTKNRYQWLLFCYCLMPDHLHFVCQLTEQNMKSINAGARGVKPKGVLDHLGRFKSYTTSQSWQLGFRVPSGRRAATIAFWTSIARSSKWSSTC
jgi:REP element-mobilizing transposase RayT